jgi:hypothetical protein
MKHLLMALTGLLLLTTGIRADAGFSIRRKTAASHLRFQGTASLGDYRLVHVRLSSGYYDTVIQRYVYRFADTVNDALVIVRQNGGKRWDESDRYVNLLLFDAAGRKTDSLVFFLKKHNLTLQITGVKDGKLQYSTEKSKAVYDYTVTGDEESIQGNKVSRGFFIGTSLLGFLLLAWMLYRRRQPSTT